MKQAEAIRIIEKCDWILDAESGLWSVIDPDIFYYLYADSCVENPLKFPQDPYEKVGDILSNIEELT